MKLKEQLQDIMPIVNWSYVSKHYFGKSNSWIYHKLDGVDGNRKPIVASDGDVENMRRSLLDIASRITTAAESLAQNNADNASA